MLKKRKKKKPLVLPIPSAGCPFCWQWLPKPKKGAQTQSRELPAGQCPCGAYFVIDLTGKSGGQAMVDLQTLAAGGDIDAGMRLREGEDFELKTKQIETEASPGGRVVRGHSHVGPKIWTLRLAGQERLDE